MVSFCSSKNNVLWKHRVVSFDRNSEDMPPLILQRKQPSARRLCWCFYFFFHYWSHMACADTSKPHQFLNNSMEYKMPINSDTEDKCHHMPVSWHILLHNTIYYFKQSFIFFLVFMLSLYINIIIHILLVPWDSQTQTTL